MGVNLIVRIEIVYHNLKPVITIQNVIIFCYGHVMIIVVKTIFYYIFFVEFNFLIVFLILKLPIIAIA